MVRQVGANRDLMRRQRISAQALELWRAGDMSTFCIARELETDEREICHILEEAEGRATKFEEGRV
ncbi:hypothetical protein [Rhizobium oryzicola]|uniref:DUF3606 domain-containing protein n=1 Tax=Rhizobium oryzicola TaxID=1232668 RepID=A0ABT8SWP0_9HYPH|nr:hypothetical protein [Rhizobium oryzicola]MDO1582411.1 hypothetical protein [Rhizobium oryzicola]